MFPADYFRYCSAACTMEEAFKGLTYKPKYLVADDEGINHIVESDEIHGLVGRLPCKLFSANTANTKFESVFADLQFCAFINFNSYKMNTLNGGTYNVNQRGIKYPPDLLKYNT